MEILFLGTSSMVPTKERNQNGILLSCGSEKVLVDCGEGIQRQLKFAGVSLTKITKILISHLHGDHVFGLPGLLQSMAASEYQKPLYVYGPKGIKKFFDKLVDAFLLKNKFDIRIIEVVSGKVFENKEFLIETAPLDHSVKTQGYFIV